MKRVEESEATDLVGRNESGGLQPPHLETWRTHLMTIFLAGIERGSPDLMNQRTKGSLTSEGLEVFRRALTLNTLPQIVACTKDLRSLIDQARVNTVPRPIYFLDETRSAQPQH